jgi:hypothetical protein
VVKDLIRSRPQRCPIAHLDLDCHTRPVSASRRQ